MRSKGSNQNRFVRFITLPIRVLSKAKDFYVRSLTDCAERVSYDSIMGLPASGSVSSLPKSFSISSSSRSSSADSEDLRELIRAASTRSLGGRVEMDMYMQQQQQQQRQMRRSTVAAGAVTVPRSCSVGMGRIDEDRPCDFGDNIVNNVRPELVYPRSRSYAVTKRSVVF